MHSSYVISNPLGFWVVQGGGGGGDNGVRGENCYRGDGFAVATKRTVGTVTHDHRSCLQECTDTSNHHVNLPRCNTHSKIVVRLLVT